MFYKQYVYALLKKQAIDSKLPFSKGNSKTFLSFHYKLIKYYELVQEQVQSIKSKKMLNHGNKSRSHRFVNICSGYLPEPQSKSPDW